MWKIAAGGIIGYLIGKGMCNVAIVDAVTDIVDPIVDPILGEDLYGCGPGFVPDPQQPGKCMPDGAANMKYWGR